MSTITLDRVSDQGAIANSDKSFFEKVLESVRSETRSFLEQCKLLWESKQLPLPEWNNIKQLLGWSSHTANPYIKIWQWISDLGINSYNLELLDINTIKSLCCDKYLDVWYQLQSTRMVVEDVRSLMADINKSSKAVKEPPKVLEWEKDKYGDRRLVIRLEDPDTGAELEKQFKESEKVSVALFLKELLRRPTVDEQVLAQHELDVYVEKEQVELPEDIKAEIAREDRISELTAELRQVNQAIADFRSAGYKEENHPLTVVVDRKSAIKRELLLYGVVPLERITS